MWGRLLRRLGRRRWFARLAAPIAAPVDRAVHSATRGRRMAVPRTLPSLLLATTGRRTGARRQTPLLRLDTESGWVVAGTNWGRRATPDWVLNLEANPEAEVDIDGRSWPVVASPVAEDDRPAVWAAFNAMWPGYASYREWASSRVIRLFRLQRR